jgi:hypothetical protein
MSINEPVPPASPPPVEQPSEPAHEKITLDGVPTDDALPRTEPSDPNATDAASREDHGEGAS